jgi:23S rRNA pseudouridine1911/1915/1917 synthase
MAVTEHGRAARTHYRVLERYAKATLLECSLDTGRTHQIRVHLQSIGHPLVGDPVYRAGRGAAPGPLASFKRQALHAYRLGLVHPVSGAAMEWEAPLPEDMRVLLCGLAK